MAHRKNFSEDEIINMRLRRKAGESVKSIAWDYDCCKGTITYHTNKSARRNILKRNSKWEKRNRAHRTERQRRRQCPAS